MLQLFGSPQWHAAAAGAGAPRPVPATVPGCLLVYLAAQAEGQGAWLDRERLSVFFWPERTAAEGLHNLRVNLHRLRGLLAAWGQADALQTERTRVRLALPTDLARLPAVLAGHDAQALVGLRPAGWLQGFRLGGFGDFWTWSAQEHARWQEAWLFACERALVAGLERAAAAPHLLALFAAWQADGGQAMTTLAALDPALLAPEVRRTWQHLCARLPLAPALQAARAMPLQPGAAAPRMPQRGAQPLAGRAAEQDALRASSAPATVLLGEPGAGKTTLLTSCWPDAPLLRAREGLGGVPYAAPLEWLRAHAQTVDRLLQPAATAQVAASKQPTRALQPTATRPPRQRPTDAGTTQPTPKTQSTSLAPYRLDLARLLPELAPDDPLPPLDALTAKARLLEALARVFEAQGPVLLVDDLQWCDSATLEWLVFMAHRGRLRWRASARPHELAGAPRQALDSLHAARLLAEQRLPPLDRQALADVCQQRWPLQDWAPARLDELHRACAGNPFVLGELVAAGAGRGVDGPLPQRVRELLARRLRAISAPAREVVEAVAVLGVPAPLPMLLALLTDAVDETAAWRACEEALTAELVVEEGGALQCRHDLIRHATLAGLGTARRHWLHRRAAVALGAQPQAEALAVAAHWEAAQEPQTALAWLHRGASQQKERGRFDEATALWQRVVDETLDATQALRARLALAECDLLTDLNRGRQALEAVLEQVGAVADPLLRDQIEAQCLAGLVDNAVFAGRVPHAQTLAPRLRELLPRLHTEDRIHASEVLIELAMREPDIPGARALMDQVHRLAPRRPSTLSFQAQLHWFAGDARAARDAFESLLALHPDYCGGLTIENDLAVMHNALGELSHAEAMARRSLASWQGVVHTETLSLLVLGSVLTSAGRHDEARAALDRARQLGHEQASALFEAEALVRRARLWLQCGRAADALADLDAAEPMLRDQGDPLRVSQYAVHRVLAQIDAGLAPDRTLADRLLGISLRSAHPLLHARMARIEGALARADGDPARALRAAQRQADICHEAGLLEPLAEALLLQAFAAAAAVVEGLQTGVDAQAIAAQAAALCAAQGFADPAARRAARDARARLVGASKPAVFDAAAALRRPSWAAAPA